MAATSRERAETAMPAADGADGIGKDEAFLWIGCPKDQQDWFRGTSSCIYAASKKNCAILDGCNRQ